MSERPDVARMEEPFAALERQLIDEYLVAAGEDPVALRLRGDAVALKLLVAAAVNASIRLSEMESRAHYVRDLHDGR